ncbi:MAG: Rrf2 family transcriptional regulator [Verrucomicrobia bacterium]|nr:Rrf2 family transcriptional regulator [Verrucomicrobiota bacterium]
MMCLSQTTGYAIQALACLERIGGQPCFVRDVADCTGIPRPYLAQIVNRLAHQGIVSAKRGYKGGIFLTRPPEEICLLEVVEAVEGKGWIGPCMLAVKDCDGGSVCPLRDFWEDICKQVRDKLSRTTLADVSAAIAPRHTHPIRTASTDNEQRESRNPSLQVALRNRPKAPLLPAPPFPREKTVVHDQAVECSRQGLRSTRPHRSESRA